MYTEIRASPRSGAAGLGHVHENEPELVAHQRLIPGGARVSQGAYIYIYIYMYMYMYICMYIYIYTYI